MITLEKPQKITVNSVTTQTITKKHIVVVEDDATCIGAIKFALGFEYTLVFFDKTETAMDFLVANAGNVNLIITDNHLEDSEMDGWQMVAQLKITGSLKHIPIIMQSGSNGITEETKAKLAAFLTKPYGREELIGTVKKIIGE